MQRYTMKDGVLVKDEKGDLVLFNDAVGEILGMEDKTKTLLGSEPPLSFTLEWCRWFRNRSGIQIAKFIYAAYSGRLEKTLSDAELTRLCHTN